MTGRDIFSEDDPAPLPAKRKAGRPPVPLADTFDQMMALLKPKEQQFVRYALAGNNYADAYRLVATAPLTDRSAQVSGAKMTRRQGVAHALKLGREQGAVQSLADVKHDLKAAYDEFGRVLDAAMESKQYTAAARAAELRAKLFRLIDTQQPVQAQAVTFVFKRFGDEQPETIIEGGPQ